MNIASLKQFVKTTCHGRDVSHGYKHMKCVYKNACKIMNMMSVNDNRIVNLVTYSAWLHDVADHKYDHDGKLKLQVIEFLKNELEDDVQLVVDIIDRISFSKENECRLSGRELDWNVVLGDIGCQARDIVSDADKLEAIGKIGVDRCVQYIYHKNPNVTRDELKKLVEEHAEEKLYLLSQQFIRTNAGQELAKPLHDEMVELISQL